MHPFIFHYWIVFSPIVKLWKLLRHKSTTFATFNGHQFNSFLKIIFTVKKLSLKQNQDYLNKNLTTLKTENVKFK